MTNPQPPVIAQPLLAFDPGFLFWAPLGSAETTNTVVGSVFTDAWPVAWIPLGATDAGSNFNWQTQTEQALAAEFLDPLAYKTTGRTGSIAFAVLDIHAANFKRMLNGGTLTTTGTTTTTMTTYTPPKTGQETRSMIGWESQDSTERLILRQTINTAQVSIQRAKGAARAAIPVEFSIEQPATGLDPFIHIFAGAARAA